MSDSFRKKLKDKDFTPLDNGIFRDKRVSLKARGLLCIALSLPDDWNFSIRGLVSICKENRTAIESALDELEEFGYLHRSRIQAHAQDGTFGGTAYVFCEVPEEPCAQNMHTVDLSPCAQNPHADNPHADNVPQENNKQEITKQEIPPKAPRGGRRAPKSVPEYAPELFERFWQMYPKEMRKDRPRAVAEWDRLRPSMELMHTMSLALKRQKATELWKRGIGIPYPVRWLRNRRWEDEVGRAAPAAPSQPRVLERKGVREL